LFETEYLPSLAIPKFKKPSLNRLIMPALDFTAMPTIHPCLKPFGACLGLAAFSNELALLPCVAQAALSIVVIRPTL